MSLVVAIDDIDPAKLKRQNPRSAPGSLHTDFFKATKDNPDTPTAYLVEAAPGRLSSAHFHENDQFQIVVNGKGKFGRTDHTPYSVHFARAFTPYGPLLPDKEGMSFMTLRTHYDAGAQRLSLNKDRLKQIPNRQPWQIAKKVNFPTPGSGVSLQSVPEIADDQGLFVCALTMAPRTQTTAPDPRGGNGQFLLVVKGSLVYDGNERNAMTVVFVKPEEQAFQIHAGPQGLQGLILNFPRLTPHATDAQAPSVSAGFKKWQCLLCSFEYDEALGMPEEGIPAGTRWKDVPDSWSCPDCSAAKSDFQMVEV